MIEINNGHRRREEGQRRVREIRKHIDWLLERGVTWQEIADASGVTRATLYYWYDGTYLPSKVKYESVIERIGALRLKVTAGPQDMLKKLIRNGVSVEKIQKGLRLKDNEYITRWLQGDRPQARYRAALQKFYVKQTNAL
jgi:hypothetical protein